MFIFANLHYSSVFFSSPSGLSSENFVIPSSTRILYHVKSFFDVVVIHSVFIKVGDNSLKLFTKPAIGNQLLHVNGLTPVMGIHKIRISPKGLSPESVYIAMSPSDTTFVS